MTSLWTKFIAWLSGWPEGTKEDKKMKADQELFRKEEIIEKSVKELKAGKIDARVEENGILQSSIGKTSFSESDLKENFKVLHSAVMGAKPNSFKGTFLNSISISSTLGPGIKIGVE